MTDKDGCPSCDRGLTYPGQPGHECYTYAEQAERRSKGLRDLEHPSTPRNTPEAGSGALSDSETPSRGDALAAERGKSYGHPKVSFDRIGALWTEYLKGVAIHRTENGGPALPISVPHLTGADVGKMMVLLKVSRSITDNGKADTLDDIEGYVSCLRMLED